MKKIFTLSLLAIALSVQASAHDVFVYLKGNYTPVAKGANVLSIIFNADGLSLRTSDGNVASVGYNDFDYFRFYETPLPDGIANSTAEGNGITFDGQQLRITAQAPIERVEIFTASGSRITRLAPNSQNARYSLDSYPSGLYVVKAIVSGETLTQKILKH